MAMCDDILSKEATVDPTKEPTENMLQDIVDKNERLSRRNDVLFEHVQYWRVRAITTLGCFIALSVLVLVFAIAVQFEEDGEVAEVQGVCTVEGCPTRPEEPGRVCDYCHVRSEDTEFLICLQCEGYHAVCEDDPKLYTGLPWELQRCPKPRTEEF